MYPHFCPKIKPFSSKNLAFTFHSTAPSRRSCTFSLGAVTPLMPLPSSCWTAENHPHRSSVPRVPMGSPTHMRSWLHVQGCQRRA